eukprot:3296308-Rhodomonas_salina.2
MACGMLPGECTALTALDLRENCIGPAGGRLLAAVGSGVELEGNAERYYDLGNGCVDAQTGSAVGFGARSSQASLRPSSVMFPVESESEFVHLGVEQRARLLLRLPVRARERVSSTL